ncbi:hypothetical protein Y032_0156g3107 [Ancylostoma ceylanicum]|uniref:Uncharacterized protein n=1 Tax=Ancylostoma ceylanicum TaxID=53326 RepID=A0A016SZ13_9BILA|nr:hypothetical protein Y032_0156g3107 [Ancylostoma ceylanicum]
MDPIPRAKLKKSMPGHELKSVVIDGPEALVEVVIRGSGQYSEERPVRPYFTFSRHPEGKGTDEKSNQLVSLELSSAVILQ